jgi:hypothetical protein
VDFGRFSELFLEVLVCHTPVICLVRDGSSNVAFPLDLVILIILGFARLIVVALVFIVG